MYKRQDLKKEPSFNRLNPSFSYEDINRNTFLYAGLKHEFTGQIINLNVDYEKDFIEMLVCESNTNQIYFCTYFFKDSDTYPIIGDNVTISGTLKGNYKIYHTESTELMSYSNNNYYTIYPRLLASKIKIK